MGADTCGLAASSEPAEVQAVARAASSTALANADLPMAKHNQQAPSVVPRYGNRIGTMPTRTVSTLEGLIAGFEDSAGELKRAHSLNK